MEYRRGWKELSSWDYVCTIFWPDGSREEKYVNVDDERVTEQTL